MVRFQRCKRIAHDVFYGNEDELRAGIRPSTRAFGDFLKFCVHGTRAKSTDAYACSAEFGPKRFREACNVGFGRCVNRKIRNRKKSSRRANV